MVALLLIVLVGSILVGWLVPMAFKSERPYGIAGDIIIPTIVGVLYAFIIYQYIVPMVGLTGWLAFIGTAAESIAMAALTLWILRKIKS
ncbi:MAG TPA: hypothetical protein DDW45_01795 [Gammaproteobacteria bacterium]|nr:hypothetical protein [Gammaproteobacteria bacterium]